jgi:Haem-NO-binding
VLASNAGQRTSPAERIPLDCTGPALWRRIGPVKLRAGLVEQRLKGLPPAANEEPSTMKGIIFNLLEEVVTEQLGEAWEQLLDLAEVEGAYTSLGSYPDEEFVALLQALPSHAGMGPNDLLHWFGRASIPLLAQRYPVFFEGHDSTRSLLCALNDIIHPEVRKLYPGAEVPIFDLEPVTGGERSDQVVTLGYRSARRLCGLAEGFIEGTAGHFGEQVRIEQPRCMLRGDDRCALVCTFTPSREHVRVGPG